MKIRHGGQLQFGDFVAIAETGTITFGWYCGTGKSKSFQYYYYNSPGWTKELFEDNPKHVSFQKHGFSLKSIYKMYVYGSCTNEDSTRIIKITDPESVFTNPEDLEKYKKSKEVLNSFKFPAR